MSPLWIQVGPQDGEWFLSKSLKLRVCERDWSSFQFSRVDDPLKADLILALLTSTLLFTSSIVQ